MRLRGREGGREGGEMRESLRKADGGNQCGGVDRGRMRG